MQPLFYLAGHLTSVSTEIVYTEPEQWVIDNLEALADDILKSPPNDHAFTPWCIQYQPYGVHFIDKLIGSEVYFSYDQWYNKPLTKEVGNIAMPDIDADEAWNLATRAAAAFVACNVKLPLFGTPTLTSALNICLNLYGQNILLAMLDEPEAAFHDFETVNDVIMHTHRWYIENIPKENLQPVIPWWRTQAPGHGQICGCSTQLLSSHQYAEYLAGFDNNVLSLYPHGGMIHLCGSHTQHIPTFKNMSALKSFQIEAEAALDLERYFNELREEQIFYLIPFERMTTEQALAITGGERLVVVENCDMYLKK